MSGSSSDHRKQSLYFPEEMLEEIQREAQRQDRSLSWIVQQAWRLARLELKRIPSVNDVLPRPAGRETQQEVSRDPVERPGRPTPFA